jgi:hypothetical protein
VSSEGALTRKPDLDNASVGKNTFFYRRDYPNFPAVILFFKPDKN